MTHRPVSSLPIRSNAFVAPKTADQDGDFVQAVLAEGQYEIINPVDQQPGPWLFRRLPLWVSKPDET